MISNGGWNYSDLIQLPISKRDWIIGKFADLHKKMHTYDEEE
tara:strand:+ start:849 stop:974 length:126 start_codon:yes stop_codon:yes gene_type:complete